MKPSDLQPSVALTYLKGLCTVSLLLQTELTSSRIYADTRIGSVLAHVMKLIEYFIQRFLNESNNLDVKRRTQAVVAVFADFLKDSLSSENSNVMLGQSVLKRLFIDH